MFKFYIGETFGHFQGGFHITKRGGKNQFVSGLCQFCDRAFGIGSSFFHAFDKRGFHLTAEFFFELQSPLIMGIGPAVITRWANVNKTDFRFVRTGAGADPKAQQGREQRNSNAIKSFHVCSPLAVHLLVNSESILRALAMNCPVNARLETVAQDKREH